MLAEKEFQAFLGPIDASTPDGALDALLKIRRTGFKPEDTTEYGRRWFGVTCSELLTTAQASGRFDREWMGVPAA